MTSAFRLSIAANIGLVGVVAVLLWRQHPETSPPSPAAPATRPAAVQSEAPKTSAAAEPLQPAAARPKITPAALAQLEQMGITRDHLVSALLESFHRRWDQRFTDLEKRYAPKPVPEREYVELARLRDTEQVRELKEALGEEGYLAWDKEQTLRMLNTGGVRMTPAEAGQAYQLQKEFNEAHKELQMAMEDGVADMADAGAMQAQAQEALDRKLEQLLGAQRFREMRGISDPITDVQRMSGDLNPTPGQAEAVLAAEGDYRAREAALVQRLKQNPEDAAAVSAELTAMNAAREEHLRRIFGAETYDAMKRQNDPTYKKLTQFADAWELQDHEIQSVYEVLHSFHNHADRTRAAAAMREAAGQRVDWHAINAAVDQSRQQTEAGLQTLIGGKRVWRLKQNGMLTLR